MKATGTIEVKSWDEKTWDGRPYAEVEGRKLTEAHVQFAYAGDVSGIGSCRYLMSYGDDVAFVLSDLVMPRMGGVELAERLRTTAPGVRLLFMSGYDERPYKTLSTAVSSAKPDGDAVYVIAHVDIAPTSPIKTAEVLRSQAEASRKEPGNLRFDVVQHTMRGNHFTVVEGWRNQQALDAHVAAAHTRHYRDTLQPGTGSPLDERTFKAID